MTRDVAAVEGDMRRNVAEVGGWRQDVPARNWYSAPSSHPRLPPRSPMKKRISIPLAIAGGFLLIQAVPYGREHSNPPVTGTPPWDSPRTKQLFDQACANCHSHQTIWPWYSHIAPVSWLTQNDVDDGRHHLNVSTWGAKPQKHATDAADEVREGEMPPWFYLPTHAEARLSDGEKKELADGLVRTFGEDKEPGDRD